MTTGPGVDLHDRTFHRELAAFLFEQPRAVHQLTLVDLAFGPGRIEQSERWQRVGALLAFGRQLLRLGQRQRWGDRSAAGRRMVAGGVGREDAAFSAAAARRP